MNGGASRERGVSDADDGSTGDVDGVPAKKQSAAAVSGNDDPGARRNGAVGAGLRSTVGGGEECRHCGFVFRHQAMFDIHMGFHKFDDPWRCNRCGHRCADCVDFNRHIASASHLGQV